MMPINIKTIETIDHQSKKRFDLSMCFLILVSPDSGLEIKSSINLNCTLCFFFAII